MPGGQVDADARWYVANAAREFPEPATRLPRDSGGERVKWGRAAGQKHVSRGPLLRYDAPGQKSRTTRVSLMGSNA